MYLDRNYNTERKGFLVEWIQYITHRRIYFPCWSVTRKYDALFHFDRCCIGCVVPSRHFMLTYHREMYFKLMKICFFILHDLNNYGCASTHVYTSISLFRYCMKCYFHIVLFCPFTHETIFAYGCGVFFSECHNTENLGKQIYKNTFTITITTQYFWEKKLWRLVIPDNNSMKHCFTSLDQEQRK